MKCYWCGKENTNLEIDQNGKILKHFPCNNCNQPERSKREDTVRFKRFAPLFDPNDPKDVELAKEALKMAYGDAVL